MSLTAAPAVTLTLPFTADLVAGFKAVAPFMSKDRVSPSICAAELNHRYLTATDRYAIGRYEHTDYVESVERHGEDGPAEPDAAVHLPSEVVEWIGKQKPVGSQVIVVTPGTVTIRWENDPDSIVAVQAFAPYAWNFPAVARLITDASEDAQDVAPFAIGTDRLDQLVKAGKALLKQTGRNAGWRFQMPADSGSRKLSPIRATLGARMTVMIQTMLSPR